MTKLAQLIAVEEGGWKLVNGKLTKVPGTLPARDDNPGDLRHAPGEGHPADAPDSVGSFADDETGFAELERQLDLYAGRLVTVDPVTRAEVPAHFMTLKDAIYEWAPPTENDSATYLRNVVNGFGGRVDANTPLNRVLEIQA